MNMWISLINHYLREAYRENSSVKSILNLSTLSTGRRFFHKELRVY